MNSKLYFSVVLPVFVMCALGAQAATRTWSGNGDGVSFNDPANWDAAVAAGDDLVIGSDTAITLDNNLGSVSTPFELNSITVGGSGAVEITGNPVLFTTAAEGWFFTTSNAGGVTTRIDFLLPNNTGQDAVTLTCGHATTGNAWNHYGRIAAEGNTTVRFYLQGSTTDLYGNVDLPNGTARGYTTINTSALHIYGKMTAKAWTQQTWDARGKVYFYSKGNQLGWVEARMGDIYVETADAFNEDVQFAAGYWDGSRHYLDNCARLTVSKLTSPWSTANLQGDIAYPGHAIYGLTGDNTFIYRPAEDHDCDYAFNDKGGADVLSVIYDPSTAVTVTFKERTNTLSRVLSVRRGTMAFKDRAVFTRLKDVEIYAGATLSFAASTIANPLPMIETLRISDTTAKLALAAGNCVTAAVYVGSALLPAGGSYTGAGGMGGTVVDWIEGTGVVTTKAMPTDFHYFTAGTDNLWSKTGNWSAGTLPDNTKATRIAIPGGKVTVEEGDDIVYDQNGFTTTASAEAFTIDNGATLEVNGGSLVVTNIYGQNTIKGGYDPAVTSTVKVTGGFLGLYTYDVGTGATTDSLRLGERGRLVMTGGKTAIYNKHGNNQNWNWSFRMLGSEIDLSGTAELDIATSGAPNPMFGNGRVKATGNALLTSGPSSAARIIWTPHAASGTLDVEFTDQSVLDFSNKNTVFIGGFYKDSLARVKLSGQANFKMPYSLILSVPITYPDKPAADTYAEMEISDSATASGTWYGVFVARDGTADYRFNGKLSVSGGKLTVGANQDSTSPTRNGLGIGYNAQQNGYSGTYARGTVELSGGTIETSGRTFFTVGYGNASGELVQTGGTFKYDASSVSYNARVGYYGGIGRYAFSGDGSADFTAKDFDLTFGEHGGKGTLEIGPGTGEFKAKALTVTGADSKFVFKPGAAGSLAKLTVTGTLTVSDGAKLVVDMTGFTGKQSFTLMTFDAKSGDFADADIEIVSDRPQFYKVEKNANDYRLLVHNGTMVLVK